MAQQVEVLAPPNMQSSDGWVAILLRFSREKPLGAAGAFLVLAMILVAILSPWLAPADPVRTHVRDALASPSGQYLLGSDELGRDSLSRIIYGARVSILVGFL
ncbi:MAG: ABC transporter permease, partial [Dehalococcoidia bacterium]|nr:ABC transporter permease [Dehalococcoidia bacterium]